MVAFIEVDLNFDEEITAVPLTFTRDALDVFGVDAESGESWFHRLEFLPQIWIKQKGVVHKEGPSWVQISQNFLKMIFSLPDFFSGEEGYMHRI